MEHTEYTYSLFINLRSQGDREGEISHDRKGLTPYSENKEDIFVDNLHLDDTSQRTFS